MLRLASRIVASWLRSNRGSGMLRCRAEILALAITGAVATSAAASGSGATEQPLPPKLSDSGLFVAGSVDVVRADNLPFTPQYPLWSDNAAKRRWIHLPAGTHIDASNPDAWEFPPGTRLWKEFSLGRRIETRLIERLGDGSWRFAAYVWNEDGSDAVLAPATGIRAHPVGTAPRGRYTIPGEADCRACHEGPAVPVLGVGALQLSPDRDPLAPHIERPGPDDVDLRMLVERGLLRNLPPKLLEVPPRIAAATPVERAVLGYLHANCGHCHGTTVDGSAAVPVELHLAQHASPDASATARIRRSLLELPSRFRGGRGEPVDGRMVVAGDPDRSVLLLRMRTRDPRVQMPPLGTDVPDTDSLALVERWIGGYLKPSKEKTP